jgi:hypothetical protein
MIAHAGMSDVEPVKVTFSPSTIESVILLQKETTSGTPKISLVKVDLGGSSDIGSLMTSSKLYLSFHLDGEEVDIQGDYAIANLNEIVTATFNKQRKTIHLVYTSKDEQLKIQKTSIYLYIEGVLNEISEGYKKGYDLDGTDGVYFTKETVGLSNDHSDKK